MTNVKEELIQTINALPDNTTWEDALYMLFFNYKLKKSEDDIKNGRVVTLEELDKEMEALYGHNFIKQGKARSQRNI